VVFYEPQLQELPQEWREFVLNEMNQEYFQNLSTKINQAQKANSIYPPLEYRLEALRYFPPAETKVLILGQDPYHGPGQAHGLSFSVPIGQKLPPSLRNIFKELKSDLNLDPPFSGDLSPWAKQGVLLLNSALTVEESKAGSHLNWGWNEFTDRLIQYLAANTNKLVFVLWGKYAQSKASLIPADKHLILQSAHPSPLSAHRGFFGSKVFSKINAYLIEQDRSPIEWQLD